LRLGKEALRALERLRRGALVAGANGDDEIVRRRGFAFGCEQSGAAQQRLVRGTADHERGALHAL